MNLFDKAKDKAEQAVGGAKEKAGEMTGNQDMKASGQGDQAMGEMKESGHDMRDKAAGAMKDAKDKFGGNR